MKFQCPPLKELDMEVVKQHINRALERLPWTFFAQHKPWCASIPRAHDYELGRGPYKCDCGLTVIKPRIVASADQHPTAQE